jgi:hypothetical protein
MASEHILLKTDKGFSDLARQVKEILNVADQNRKDNQKAQDKIPCVQIDP